MVQQLLLSLGDIELGSDIKFKICSQYNQIFAQFLQTEVSDICYNFISNPFFFLVEKLSVLANKIYNKKSWSPCNQVVHINILRIQAFEGMLHVIFLSFILRCLISLCISNSVRVSI